MQKRKFLIIKPFIEEIRKYSSGKKLYFAKRKFLPEDLKECLCDLCNDITVKITDNSSEDDSTKQSDVAKLSNCELNFLREALEKSFFCIVS